MIKIRKKILEKLAQETTPGATQTTQPAAELGSPTAFSASSKYPSLRIGFNTPGAVNIIDTMSNYLNSVLFYASNGKFDMEKLFQQKFNFTGSETSDRNVRLLIMLGKEIYDTIYNKGELYKEPLTKEEFIEKIKRLQNSQSINNLATTGSKLSSKMGGDVKMQLINYFTSLVNAAPQK